MRLNLSKINVKSFSKDLIAWYDINKRSLPWRNTNDPYKIWLSEIILQQTKIAQGLPYYINFVNEYPDVIKLAQASEQEVLKLWEGLGYYSRARNLHKAAKIVVNEFKGVFPSNYSELIKLPGIGDYTASAVSSFSVNAINPVVDGNVYRFLSRLIGIKTAINTNKSHKEFRSIALKLISKNNPSDFNQAIMEYGALVCKPSSPNCANCFLKKKCYAFLKSEVTLFPVKNIKKKIRERFFNFIVIKSCNHQTILEKRTGKDIWKNLYQFPLIETNSLANKETIVDQLKEIKYLDNSKKKLVLFENKSFCHKLSHQKIHYSFWLINVKKINKDQIDILDLNLYPFPKPISNFLLKFNW